MTDGAGSPGFVEKTADQLLVLRQRCVQDLHRRAAFEQRVFGKIHFPKAALAQQSDDAIVAEGLAGLQRHGLATSMVPRTAAGTTTFLPRSRFAF